METLTFSQLAAKFLAWAARCRRPSTVNVYRLFLRKFVEHFGDLVVADVRPCHLMEFGKTWHACQAVKRLFFWGHIEAGILASNPLARVKHPRKGYRRRVLTRAELVNLLRGCKRDLRNLLIGYRETYARPQELRLATWENLQGDNPDVGTREALLLGRAAIVLYDFKDAQRRQDGERPRVIVLSPRACRLLLRLFDRTNESTGPIFTTCAGRGWTANALRCRFRRLRKKLVIKRDSRGETIVPYTFRHTGATAAAAAGVRDRLLADVLGHVETKTTSRYCHLALADLRHAMGAVWHRR